MSELVKAMRKIHFSARCALVVMCAFTMAASAAQSSTDSTTKKPSTSKSKHHKSSTSASSSAVHHTSSSGKKSSRRRKSRVRGQQKIDSDRARSIQEALIREHYLTGLPTGTWNQASEDAMRKYQADHGWQSKTVPDSRALIKLGLGPSKDHLLNPESAMTTTPDVPRATSQPPVPTSDANHIPTTTTSGPPNR